MSQYTKVLEQLVEELATMQQEANAVVARNTNKAANQRLRTATLAFAKTAKEFRKVSVAFGKGE